jgi:hypothetical protein
MVVFRRKNLNDFNVLLGACDGCIGGSTSPAFCDGCTALFCDGCTSRIPTKAIGFLLAGARAIQRAIMMTATSAEMLVSTSSWLKPFAAFEPSAFFPSGKLSHCLTMKKARSVRADVWQNF